MTTLSAKTSNLLNSSKKKKIYLSSVLLILCAFFASWGAGLQNIASFDVSKIFVGFCILLILYWLVFAKHKFRAFPRSYNYFILYIILHTLIAYTIFVPEELGFGYLGESAARAEGFVVKQESYSIQIIRMFLFIFFAYAVASFVRTQKRLVAIAIAYGVGVLLSVTGVAISVLFGRELLTFMFKSDYAEYHVAFIHITIAGAVLFLFTFMNVGLQATRNFKLPLLIYSLAALTCGVFSLWLIPSHGMIGAAFALFFCYMVGFIGCSVSVARAIKKK